MLERKLDRALDRARGLLRGALLAATVASPAAAQAPVVEKVDPPSWWTPSTLNPVRVMIRGRHLAGARLECARLTCTNIKVNAAGTYVFADVRVPAGALPGKYPLRIRTSAGTADANFDITAPLPRRGRFQGFGKDDVMYLLMPDRFANGDTANDDPEISRGLLARDAPRFYHGGDLAGVRQKLPYLKDLGITAIWMNPIYDNNNGFNRKETYDNAPMADYHGYGAVDFYKVEERFGDLAEFRALVDDAHRHGIKVIADMVANHTGPYHRWVNDPPTPTWFHGTAADHPNNTWQTWSIADPYAAPEVKRATMDGWFIDILPDLNQDDPEVARYIIQNTLWWVAMSGMDGIRQDTWPYVPRTFWKPWMEAIKKEFPTLRVVGEVFDGDPAILAFHQGGVTQWDGIDAGVDALFDFPLFFPSRAAFAEGRSIRGLPQTLAYDRLYKAPESLVTFLGLHDVNRFMGDRGATVAGLKLGYTFQLTTRGTPLIYYGDEIAMAGGGDPENRRDFPGGFPGDARNAFDASGRTADEQSVHAHVQRLLRIRARRPDLRGAHTQNLVVGDQLWVYRRGNTVVAINNDTAAVTARIPVGLLGDDLLELCATPSGSGLAVEVRVPARTGCIFPVTSLAVPGPALGVAGTRVVIPKFESRHVEGRQVEIWLPPGYGRDTVRYPVLYMHDGQNVFDPATSYGGVDWSVDEWMTRLIAERKVRPAIVVAVWNTSKRAQEYMPAKALPNTTDSLKWDSGDWVAPGPWIADAYLRFLVEELKPYIDRTYRTRRGRADTFVMGSSMGGLISLYAAAEYPEVFGGVGAVSTHFPAGDGITLDYFARTIPPAATHRIYMDRGTATLDATYGPYQPRADALFRANGYRDGVNLMTKVFEGAAHDERSWRVRLEEPLRFLLHP
jgi:glycosidase/predicted alpha/beta superfamily hydrolase